MVLRVKSNITGLITMLIKNQVIFQMLKKIAAIAQGCDFGLQT